eukprot:3349196-Rhodomonas_salina.1
MRCRRIACMLCCLYGSRLLPCAAMRLSAMLCPPSLANRAVVRYGCMLLRESPSPAFFPERKSLNAVCSYACLSYAVLYGSRLLLYAPTRISRMVYHAAW